LVQSVRVVRLTSQDKNVNFADVPSNAFDIENRTICASGSASALALAKGTLGDNSALLGHGSLVERKQKKLMINIATFRVLSPVHVAAFSKSAGGDAAGRRRLFRSAGILYNFLLIAGRWAGRRSA
jgi:hypothetical protein